MTLKGLTFATQEEKDAVQRLCDAVNIHVDAQGDEAFGKFVAIRLSDGRSPDGTLYPTRGDAARYQPDPWCFYVKVNPGGIQPNEAWVVLGYARQAKKSNIVFQTEEPIVPMMLEHGGSWLRRQRMSLLPGGTFSHG